MKATNTVNGWSVSQGDAEVVISGGRFEAKLSDSTGQIVSSLEGTIRNANVTAKERIAASDFSGSTYHGTLAKKTWPEFANTTGAETLMLSDGWGIIGLRRSLSK
jgi:hypothetical protein